MIELIGSALPVIVFLLLAVYVLFISYYARGFGRLHRGTNEQQYTVTVIVPARNEEATIGQCVESLLAQDYPSDRYSIIVVDDSSTDGTAGIVKQMIGSSKRPVTLVTVGERPAGVSPKVNALQAGIAVSTGDIIMTTDADCRAQRRWISETVRMFEPAVGVVTGVTTYEDGNAVSALFRGMQFLDFVSYTAVGAGAIGTGRLIVCNGSNMAFRREAFTDAGGFTSMKHLNSGDDSLLGQMIVATKRWMPRFTLGDDALVVTRPVGSIGAFFHQRMRWAGQTTEYPAAVLMFMTSTFLMYVLLFLWLPVTMFSWSSIPWIVWGTKVVFDYAVMRRFCSLANLGNAMRYYGPTALVHIPVIVLSVIGGMLIPYRWKGAVVRRSAV